MVAAPQAGNAPQGSGAQARSGSAPAGAAPAGPAKVYRLHFSRDWIARSGPKRRRQTLLIFELRRPALVEFLVFRLAPNCVRIGRFHVQGHQGLNRVRFRGRIGERRLGPGTYRISAKALPAGRTVVDTRLIVVPRANRSEIRAARGANDCSSHGNGAASSGAAGGGTGAANRPAAGSSATGATIRHGTNRIGPRRTHGVLGARFTRAVNAIEGIPLWLFLLLGLAIAMLAVAALPLRATPNGRTAAMLVQRRGMITLAGALALAAVAVSYVVR